MRKTVDRAPPLQPWQVDRLRILFTAHRAEQAKLKERP